MSDFTNDDYDGGSISHAIAQQEGYDLTMLDDSPITDLIAKYNTAHDKLGMFASKPGQASAEGAAPNDSPHAVLHAAGLKNVGGPGDVEEYPTAAAARKAAGPWKDYSHAAVMTGDGSVRHIVARFTPESKKVIASGETTSGAKKKPAEKKPNTTIPHDGSTPRAGFSRVTDTDSREALMQTHGVRVPPGWTDVQAAKNPSGVKQARGGMLIATGKDAKGRTQYLYSAQHTEGASAKKFAKVKKTQANAPKLDRKLKADAIENPTAASALLIRKLGIRPGSDKNTGADKKAFGATNLEARHAKVNPGGKSVTIDYDSKKGGHSRITTRDPQIVAAITAHKAGKRPTDKLFPGVNEGKVNAYIKGAMGNEFSAKDLRTLVGTAHAAALVKNMPVPTTKTAATKARNEVGDKVSNILQNTRSVALGSYIAPEVFTGWPS